MNPGESGSDQAILLKFNYNNSKNGCFEGLNDRFRDKIAAIKIALHTCRGPNPDWKLILVNATVVLNRKPFQHIV